MQYELRELQQRLGITFVFVTHDQEEALAMSDWIFVMNDGEIVQSGTPVDIYDEPINHFVATFIGESNILPGTMIEDYLVEFNGKRFEAVDGGMKPNEPVEVVIRPEDLRITLPEEGKLRVKVDTQLFHGVHYEIIAYDELGNEWMIHSTRKAIVGDEIDLTLNQKTSTSCVSMKPKKSSMLLSKNTWKSGRARSRSDQCDRGGKEMKKK